MFNLGMCYEKGEGVSARDPQESVRLFRLAAEGGHADAKRVLQRIEQRNAAPAPEQARTEAMVVFRGSRGEILLSLA